MVEDSDVESHPEANVRDISEHDVEDLEKSLNDDLIKKDNVGWWGGGHRRSISRNSHVSHVSKKRVHNQPISVRCG